MKTILGVAVPNSGPLDLESSPFLNYEAMQPASATSSRSEVSLGGLQEAVELRQQVVEQEQMLSDLKMKAQASDAAMKMQSEKIESLKKAVRETEYLLCQLLNFRG